MKKKVVFIISFVSLLSLTVGAQTKVYPVIKDFGAVHVMPNVADLPDPIMKYNIIVEVGASIEHPDSIYVPLDHIARIYNLHVYGGVKQKNLQLDLVIFGNGITAILNNDAYKKKYGVDNPNLKIIEEMKQAGISLFACSQSVSVFKIDPATVNPNITVVLSRATTVSTRQMKGYAFFKF